MKAKNENCALRVPRRLRTSPDTGVLGEFRGQKATRPTDIGAPLAFVVELLGEVEVADLEDSSLLLEENVRALQVLCATRQQ